MFGKEDVVTNKESVLGIIDFEDVSLFLQELPRAYGTFKEIYNELERIYQSIQILY